MHGFRFMEEIWGMQSSSLTWWGCEAGSVLGVLSWMDKANLSKTNMGHAPYLRYLIRGNENIIFLSKGNALGK